MRRYDAGRESASGKAKRVDTNSVERWFNTKNRLASIGYGWLWI